MLLLVQYGHDVALAAFPYVSGPGNEPFAAPFADEAVVGGHVLGQSGIAVTFPVPSVHGQPFMLVVDLDHTVGIDELYLFADMPVVHAVIVLVPAKVDMAVLVHGGLGVPFYLMAFFGQGHQFPAFHLEEQ